MPKRTDIQSGSGKGQVDDLLGLFTNDPFQKWIEPIRRLPLREGISSDAVEKAAEVICFRHMKSDELDLPKSRCARSIVAARAEAEQFFKLAHKLWKHMEKMHVESRAAIDETNYRPGMPEGHFISMDDFEHHTAKFTMATFKALQNFPSGIKASKQPTKAHAAAIADECAEQFLALTGKMPTISVDISTHKAGGPFLEFLDAFYKLFEISASPEAMGRAAIARMKKRHGPAIVHIDPAAMEKKPKKSPK